MLAEAYAWLTAPCLPAARRLGYLRESIALAARSRRCRDAWQYHLERSRQALLRSAGEGGGKALVIGSGLLLDVPLNELADRFAWVVLADIVHLPEAREIAGRYANVQLLEIDVTGTVDMLARRKGIPAPDQPPKLPGQPFAWAASLNVWSQLPLRPLRALRRQRALEERDLPVWQDRLLAAHLRWLPKLAPRGCLLADLMQLTVDQGGGLEEMVDFRPLLADLGDPAERWPWAIAPPGELGRDRLATHEVGAWFWQDGTLNNP